MTVYGGDGVAAAVGEAPLAFTRTQRCSLGRRCSGPDRCRWPGARFESLATRSTADQNHPSTTPTSIPTPAPTSSRGRKRSGSSDPPCSECRTEPRRTSGRGWTGTRPSVAPSPTAPLAAHRGTLTTCRHWCCRSGGCSQTPSLWRPCRRRRRTSAASTSTTISAWRCPMKRDRATTATPVV